MDYKIYPFKRYGKYRLYVQFVNSYGDEVTLSTGETYSLKAKKQERIDAYKNAQKKIKQIVARHEKKITINIEIRGIKAAFSWAYKHDILEKHPLKGQGFLFDAKAHRRAFTDHELTRLFKFTDGKMIGLVIRLAYNTGMRVGELSAIKWKMVDLKNRSIFLPAEITKTNSSRSVPLNPNAFNIAKILESQLRTKR